MSIKRATKNAKRLKAKAKKKAKPLNPDHYSFDPDVEVDMWHGFSSKESAEQHSDLNPTVLTLVCNINKENESHFREIYPGRFRFGDWYVVAGHCDNAVMSGPFSNFNEAVDYSSKTYGAEHHVFGGW